MFVSTSPPSSPVPVSPPGSTSALNERQQAVVDHRGSPLLVVAGAGTGKTRTLVARVAQLLDEGADPDRVLLLTFTRRSAAEMIHRVELCCPSSHADRVWAGTFHAIGHRLLRSFGDAGGLDPSFTVLDQADATDLLGVVRTELGLGERARRFPRTETVAGIYSRMVNAQARLGDVLQRDYPWCVDHIDDLRTVFTDYTARKRAGRVLDFDDLLLFWRGVTSGPAGDELRSRFDHVLVDEYQDTNPIQADIVSGMCRPDTDVCVVGDDAQAIYGFRAATVENMWSFADRFPGAGKITLERNYRSTMPILTIANAVMQRAPGADVHFHKSLWSDRVGGVAPRLLTHHDEAAQSCAVADAVLEARERGIDLRDQAVLTRAGHHSDGLEIELTRRNIPFVKYGGLAYLETAHVKDLLAVLRIADNPADEMAWHRVLSALAGVGPATIRRIGDDLGIKRHEPDALDRFIAGDAHLPASAAEQGTALRSVLADCTTGDLDPAQQVERVADWCELVFPARYDNASARLADIGQLSASARGYRSRGRFLAELTLDPPSRTSELAAEPHLDDDWLTVSTIHSAKGLEWRSVHVLHAADGNIPSDMAIGSGDATDPGLAEELRLLYVALTRARDELQVHVPLRFHVHKRARDDRHVYGQLSRFLEPVRDLFATETVLDPGDMHHDAGTERVGTTDEVDTLLHALWG